MIETADINRRDYHEAMDIFPSFRTNITNAAPAYIERTHYFSQANKLSLAIYH